MLSASRLIGSRSFVRSLASLRDGVRKIRPEELYGPIIEDKRVYPEYDVVNVRLRGFDYVPLEKFQSYVGKISKRFGFEVVESYAVAAITEDVVIYKRGSIIPDSKIQISHYDRWICLKSVQAIRLPIFLQLLRAHSPVGVRISVKEHTKDDEDYRYIPDLLLKERQDELKSLDDPQVRKALGWE